MENVFQSLFGRTLGSMSIVAKCLLAASICYGLSSLMRTTPTESAGVSEVRQ